MLLCFEAAPARSVGRCPSAPYAPNDAGPPSCRLPTPRRAAAIAPGCTVYTSKMSLQEEAGLTVVAENASSAFVEVQVDMSDCSEMVSTRGSFIVQDTVAPGLRRAVGRVYQWDVEAGASDAIVLRFLKPAGKVRVKLWVKRGCSPRYTQIMALGWPPGRGCFFQRARAARFEKMFPFSPGANLSANRIGQGFDWWGGSVLLWFWVRVATG